MQIGDLRVKYATHGSDCRKFFCRFLLFGSPSSLVLSLPILCSICIYMSGESGGIVILLKLPRGGWVIHGRPRRGKGNSIDDGSVSTLPIAWSAVECFSALSFGCSRCSLSVVS